MRASITGYSPYPKEQHWLPPDNAITDNARGQGSNREAGRSDICWGQRTFPSAVSALLSPGSWCHSAFITLAAGGG